MKWLKKAINEWLNSYHDEDNFTVSNRSNRINLEFLDNDLNTKPVLHFKVFSAVGGRIVEFRSYNSNTTDWQHTTYIIGDDEDFGETIAQIANLENLKT